MNQHCPLLFSIREKVYGNDWIAEVSAEGRVLLTREEDAYRMYGVIPGAIAASGTSPRETYVDFRRRFISVLFDIAERTRTFDQFVSEAEGFFYEETDAETGREWEVAVAEARAGRVKVDGIPTRSADEPRAIRIDLKEHFTPQDNQLELEPEAAFAKAA